MATMDDEETDVAFDIKKNLDDELADEDKPVEEVEEEKSPDTVDTDLMKVYLRVRPFSDSEITMGENQVSIVLNMLKGMNS